MADDMRRGDMSGAAGNATRRDNDFLSDPHPERYVIGKPHPDRARQFKPFAALKGYYDMLEERE